MPDPQGYLRDMGASRDARMISQDITLLVLQASLGPSELLPIHAGC